MSKISMDSQITSSDFDVGGSIDPEGSSFFENSFQDFGLRADVCL